MRRDVLELRRFYATPLGWAARTMIARKIDEAWGEASGLDVAGLGYPSPLLETARRGARRCIVAMPAAQGVEAWPQGALNLACLSEEGSLPFANALFDRVLLVHALEESADPLALLQEACRIMAPNGRLIVVAASRLGWWSNAEQTPFGHGRPYTRGQLEGLVRGAGLEPFAWSRALYAPSMNWAVRFADAFEVLGACLWPMASGVILMEAVKETFAVKPRASPVKGRVLAGALKPAAAQSAPQTEAPARRRRLNAWNRAQTR